MTRPLLLLDVDGVLNPFECAACPDGFTEELIIGFYVRLSRQHGVWLRKLAEMYDVVWATTWGTDAQTEIAPRLALPEWPCMTFDLAANVPTWKLPDVAAFVGDRAVAWVDDDLHADARAWAAEAPNRMLLQPDPAVGLTRVEVDRLVEFAGGLPSG